MISGKRGGGRMVYVVDDEKLLAQIMEAILERDDFRVRMFTDPAVLWEAFQQDPNAPALLVTDFVMEPFNGMELLERCRRLRPDLPALVVSGNSSEDVIRSAPVEPNAFLEKPFLPQTFLEVVHRVLGS